MKNSDEVYKYLKGIKDIKIPAIYKVLFIPILGILLTIIGFFITFSNYFSKYSDYLIIIYLLLIILFGICALFFVLIKMYAPEFILELMKIKMFRKANECMIVFVDELGIMDTSVGKIDFSLREVVDKGTGLRYEFSDEDIAYYYRVPVLFVSGSSGRALPVKYANAIYKLNELGFKSIKDVKKFLNDIDKNIGEKTNQLKKLKREIEISYNKNKDEIKYKIDKLNTEIEELNFIKNEIEEAIQTLPNTTMKLKNIVKVLGNENPEIKMAKAQRYYLAGYTRGLNDEGFIQILKWITLIAALISIPVVAYIVVKALGGSV